MTDEIFQAVDGISAETVDALRRQSAAALPDHPTERGYRAEQIKRALWEPMIGREISLVGEVNRMIGALNARLALLNTLLSGGSIPVGEQQATLDKLCRLALADDIVNHNGSDSAHKDIREALAQFTGPKGEGTVNSSPIGSVSGFGTMVLPCKTYIKDELLMNCANGALTFEWHQEGAIVAQDGTPREAIIAYRYWCNDLDNYSYEHITTDTFPVSVPTEHTVDTRYMDVLFAGILASDEEMDDTDTKESLTAPMASGFACFSCGKGAYAGGYLSTAWKPASLAYGYKCLAFGDNAIALGSAAQALADKSIAIGQGVVAKTKRGQVVLGRYNVIDEKGEYAFIFGNGTDHPDVSRSNAITMEQNGNMWFAGKLSVENQAVTADNDLTPKSYVDDAVRKAAGILPASNAFIQGIDGEASVSYKTSLEQWYWTVRFVEGDVPTTDKQGAGHGSYLAEYGKYTNITGDAPTIMEAKLDGVIDCSDTELVGVWMKYEPTAAEGETSMANLTLEVTSGSKPDVGEVYYNFTASTLKEGWHFYKLDLNTDQSVPVKYGALKGRPYENKGEINLSKMNFMRVYGKCAHCRISIGQCAKIAKVANDEFICRDVESMLTLDASGKVTAICGHSIA